MKIPTDQPVHDLPPVDYTIAFFYQDEVLIRRYMPTPPRVGEHIKIISSEELKYPELYTIKSVTYDILARSEQDEYEGRYRCRFASCELVACKKAASDTPPEGQP